MKMLTRKFFNKMFSVLLLTALLSGAFAATTSAQNRRTNPARTNSSVPVSQTTGQGGDNQFKQCNGGWSGVIKFSKTLKVESAPTESKSVTTVRTTHAASRDYDYRGSLFVESKAPYQWRTRAQVSLTDVEKKTKISRDREDCRYDNAPPIDVFIETTESETTNGFGEGEGQFHLSVNPLTGTYAFNFRMPEAKGTTDAQAATRAKQCIQKDYPPTNKKFPVIIPGFGANVEGQRIDPKNPDVLAGTKTWDTSTGSVKSFTYTVSWTFKRCPAPLELEAVEFDENPLPDWNSWTDAKGDGVDGNRVRIRARVTNYSSETKFPKLNFRELRADIELPGSETNISIAPGESREVQYIWDTSGWAWETGAKAASERRVKVELTEPTAPRKELTAAFTVIPRPVVLVHGLWADSSAWTGYQDYLNQAHGGLWRAFAVGDNPSVALMKTGEKGKPTPSNSIAQNAVELDKEIRHVTKKMNAWHVDIVAHSMGGLIARYYIQNFMQRVPDDKPQVTRLVMLGTPNTGSPCAYLIDFTFWAYRQQTQAIKDLTPASVERFNYLNRNRRGTRFSVLIGTAVPQTCQSQIWGDGVVEIPSARWEIRDFRYVRALHTALTERHHFTNFVLPRLGVSHRGDHSPEPYASLLNDNLPDSPFANASFKQTDDAEKPQLPANLKLDASKLVAVPAKQAAEIEIPVATNANAGVAFVAPPHVSATLYDEKGAIAGKNSAGTAESNMEFRGILIQAKIGGVWKLKLENTGAEEASAVVAAWTDTAAARVDFSVEAGKPNAAGQIPLTAKLTETGAPLVSARVTVQILDEDGKTTEIALLDDGARGDGAAHDGVYGALTEKPSNGEHSVTAKAELGGQTFVAATSFTVGAAQNQSTPLKTPAKKAKK